MDGFSALPFGSKRPGTVRAAPGLAVAEASWRTTPSALQALSMHLDAFAVPHIADDAIAITQTDLESLRRARSAFS
jgi:hypothetical protein